MPPVSQKDLAQLLGLNQATVSRALRGDPRISAATRKRVLTAAQTENYQLDAAVARLAARRWRPTDSRLSGSIAWLRFPHPNGHYMRASAPEASALAARYGYSLDLIDVPQKQNIKALARMLLARGYDGIILGRIFDPEFVELFPWEKFTCVCCEEGHVHVPCDQVLFDLRTPYTVMWQRICEAGFRRVGAMMLEEPKATDFFDKMAILNQLARGSSDVKLLEPLFYGDSDPFREETHVAVRDWVETQRPDVILGFNDGTYWAVVLSGYQVPEDVAFVSLMRDMSTNDPISGIDVSQMKVAATAIERLDRLIRHYHKGLPENRLKITVEPLWVQRRSMPMRAQR